MAWQAGEIVMRPLVCSFLVLYLLSIFAAHWQLRAPGGREFQITKISKNLVATPDYGISQYRANANERWLEVEVEFNAAPEWTEELTLRYFVLFNGRLFTGEVTHINIDGGLNRSVMYLLPIALARFGGNRALLPNAFQNIAVQIAHGGAIQDESSIARAPVQWFASLPPISGFMLNKNETPFAPLYWDRYTQIKVR